MPAAEVSGRAIAFDVDAASDTAEEAVQWARDAAVRPFGLSHGPRIDRHWFLWE